MITLNLLPLEEKKELRLEKISRLIIYYGSAFFSLTIIFIILLLNIWFFFFIQLKSLNKMIDARENSISFENIKKLEARIEEANKNLTVINNIQTQQKRNSVFLEDLANLVPPGIILSTLSFDVSSGKVNLNGFTPSAERFLSFQDALKKNPNFSQIEWPLSNLNSSESGASSFVISFQVNK